MTVQQLYAEARRLPPEQSAELFDMLLVDTFSQPDTKIEAAWGKEIDRRLAEIESGTVPGIAAEDALAEIRKRVGL